MTRPSKKTQKALLNRLCPSAQTWGDVPVIPLPRRTRFEALSRMHGEMYLWDDEARSHLGPSSMVIDCASGALVEFATDENGIDGYHVSRQVEWRLNLRALMQANPGWRRGVELPDWDPADYWAPLGRRDEWQRRRPCLSVPWTADADVRSLPTVCPAE